MATVRQQIRAGLWRWFRDVNGLTDSDDVIFAYEDGPRPEKPYATILVGSANQPQWSESVPGTKNGNRSHRTHAGRIATATINGFGEPTDDWLERAQLSLRNAKVRENLRDDGLVVRRFPGGVDDVTEILDTDHERRFVVEFQIAYEIVTEEVETYPSMSVLDLELELVDGAKGDTLTETLSFNA